MIKRLRYVVSLLILLSLTPPMFSLANDLGISFGHVGLFDQYYHDGLHVHLGVVKGITERLEANVFTQSEITPTVFGDVQVGLDIAYSLLGKRWDKHGYAGSGVNMLVSLGVLAGSHNPRSAFTIDSLYVKFTPVTVGTPHSGKRDRVLSMGVNWNIHANTFSLVWNFMISDIYVLGTWRDEVN